MSQQDFVSRDGEAQGDWLLRTWVSTAGKGNGGLGVTLTTAAGLISGVMISEMEFLDGTTEAVADAFNGEGEAFRGLFEQFRNFVQDKPITHIHLKNAKL